MISLYDDVARSLTAGPEQDRAVTTAEFVFPATFAGFDGHFPGNPIVPGIAQMFAVQAAASAACGTRLAIKETVRCKFTRPVLPEEILRVSFRGEWSGPVMQCKADLAVNGEPCAAMTLLLEKTA